MCVILVIILIIRRAVTRGYNDNEEDYPDVNDGLLIYISLSQRGDR